MKTEKKNNYRDKLLQLSCLFLVYSAITAIISGLLCTCYYIPTPAGAALSLDYIQEHVFAGAIIVRIHKLSGILVFLFTVLYFVITLFSKKPSDSSKKSLQACISLILFLIALFVTGYVLSGTPSALSFIRDLSGRLTDTQCCPETVPALVSTLSFVFIRIYLLHCYLLPLIVGWMVFSLVKNRFRKQENTQISRITPFVFFTAGIVILALGIQLLGIPF